jgi:ABC-type dipeptide/oligopeptide/nickel transport system permease component
MQIFIGALCMLLFLAYTALTFYIGRRTAPKQASESTTKELTPEQLESKRKREQLEDQFGKIFTYKRR